MTDTGYLSCPHPDRPQLYNYVDADTVVHKCAECWEADRAWWEEQRRRKEAKGR